MSMRPFLILKLAGPMQAWGAHTFEDFRPTLPFPTLSALAGLLGACLGIQRCERDRLVELAESIDITIRADRLAKGRPVTITDFHTVMKARKVGGGVNAFPVVSRREYLCDAVFTVAVTESDIAKVSLDTISEAVKRPVYTPFLGRRSCPLSRPLYEGWVDAADAVAALQQVAPCSGVLFGVSPEQGESRRLVRDVPLSRYRQFGTREISVLVTSGGDDVSE